MSFCSEYDIAVIGAGVVGAMTARELSKYDLSVCIVEKENDIACGASKANSGIIHGGYDPKPGSLKAKLNVEGVPKLYKTAKELNVPCVNNGSLVVAFNKSEKEILNKLCERGIANGVKGLKMLSDCELHRTEPAVSTEAIAAMLVPTGGIICPYELTIAATGNAMDNGVELKCNFEVIKIEKTNDKFVLKSSDGQIIRAKWVINCAGVYSDKISEMLSDESFKIIPRAGEYLLLDKTEGTIVNHTIFQVPTDAGKGVLVTPTVDGNLLIGPTSGTIPEKDNTKTTFTGMENVRRLAFVSVPGISFKEVITSFCGVRASEKDGDFIIKSSDKVKGFIHAAAIDSPGLTSCVSIAEMITDILREEGAVLSAKINWNGSRRDPHAFRKMNEDEQREYIGKYPLYGHIVCRCENVSEGEIINALEQNPPAKDIDGIKRRTRAGMGRCQGGFCSPQVMKLISEKLGIDFDSVTKKGDGSELLTGKL